MIEILLIINIILGWIIILTTSMIQNHFKKIVRSMSVYTDKKIYKSQKDISFLKSLLEHYNIILEYKQQNVDVGAMIQNIFYEQRIGRFRYTRVQSIAVNGKTLMWTILMGQIGLTLLIKGLQYSQIDAILIIISTLWCLIISLFGVIKSVQEERDGLFVRLEDYVVNTYPAEIEWKSKDKDIKRLEDKVNQLEEELYSYQIKVNNNSQELDIGVEEDTQKEDIEKDNTEKEYKDILKAKDIASLLDQIKLNF